MVDKDFLVWVEKQGKILRHKGLVNSIDVLDPFLLAKKMGVIVLSLNDIQGLSQEVLNQLLVKDKKGWSAGAIKVPGGKFVVVMNPMHAPTRRRASLMEELAHLHLGHKPSVLTLNGDLTSRSHDKACEKQAYWVGAAALIPSSIMVYAQENRMSKKALAEFCLVSLPLVNFRTNITGIKLG